MHGQQNIKPIYKVLYKNFQEKIYLGKLMAQVGKLH